MNARNKMRPIHPGEVLRAEYLEPLGMTPHALAVRLRVTPSRINEIVNEERPVTLDTAMRLARFFNTTPEFWMNLQQTYALKTLPEPLVQEIKRDIHPLGA
ncbi:MAG TPA: HigA family addiction module antitoxin [Gammaproteobacteria bacterium]|jgi:addiction module HigA family antidote|nr:HigA family addiction module antitoxin [Gammaproteobacteria bacterium]